MLRISLFFFLAFLGWPLSALAQGSGSEVLQIFEFDYDQQKTAPMVNLPPVKTETPAAAPSPVPAPVAAPPAPAKAPEIKPVAKPIAPIAAPPAAPAPRAAAPAKPPAKPAAPASVKNGVITIIGEPDPPGAKYDDYLPDHRAEEINLSPAGLPPTTSVPAKPGEARVEKAGTGKPAARRPAPAAAPQPPPPPPAAAADFKPGSVHRYWQLAQNNWARYGGTPYSRPPTKARIAPYDGSRYGLVGYTPAGRPLLDLTYFPGLSQ
ncbi:MAG: hypothetical protein FWG97_04800 [Deltaproteobacteria bacterium]|nr:hypothetical protein [Deltaproteobacteria bacterium]